MDSPRSRITPFRAIAAFAVAAALLLVWGRETPPAPEPMPPAAEAEVAPAPVARVHPEANRVAEGAEALLDQHLPSDVPEYPTHTPVRALVKRSGRSMARFATVDAPAMVQDFYLERLPEAGWTIDTQSGSGGLRVVKASQDDRRLSVMIPKPGAGEETLVTVLVTN